MHCIAAACGLFSSCGKQELHFLVARELLHTGQDTVLKALASCGPFAWQSNKALLPLHPKPWDSPDTCMETEFYLLIQQSFKIFPWWGDLEDQAWWGQCFPAPCDQHPLESVRCSSAHPRDKEASGFTFSLNYPEASNAGRNIVGHYLNN